MRPLALAVPIVSCLACSGVELFPDTEVLDVDRETATTWFRVPDGASHVYGLHQTSIDVDSVRVCFVATPALIEAQRAEALGKGAVRVPQLAPDPSWPDFDGLFGWHEPAWWPTDAEEVYRWHEPAMVSGDMGYGVLWTLDGDRACVWSWNLQFWTP